MSDDGEKEWNLILKKAEVILKSGLLPPQINTIEKVATIMIKAKELQVPVMEALSNFYITEDKITTTAQQMLAMIFRSGLLKAISYEGDTTKASCKMSRKDTDAEYTHTFTIENGQRASLLEKEIWKKYPREMLLSRAISGCARKVFPDVIGGIYTAEELEGIKKFSIEKQESLIPEELEEIKKPLVEKRQSPIPEVSFAKESLTEEELIDLMPEDDFDLLEGDTDLAIIEDNKEESYTPEEIIEEIPKNKGDRKHKEKTTKKELDLF